VSRGRLSAVAGKVASVPDADVLAEAELYVRWLRGAVGRFHETERAAPSTGLTSPPPTGARDGDAIATQHVVRVAHAADATDALPGTRSPSSLSVLPAPPAPPAPLAVPAPPAPPAAALPAPAPGDSAGEAGEAGDADSSLGEDRFERLRVDALACHRCRLCETRSTVVFGEGSRRPRLMVIGEAPGADEDASGRPFVGKAGQLVTRMLAAIGLRREDVFIGNVLKCRPPGNRAPLPDEVAACRPFLDEQMRLIDPALILLLGNHAARAVLGTDRGISSLRGRIVATPSGRPALPTFHPAYLLRSPEHKREAWLDLQLVAKTLGLAVPSGRKAAGAPDADDRPPSG